MSEWTYTRGGMPLLAGRSVVVILAGDGAEAQARRLLPVVPEAESPGAVLDELVAEGDLRAVPAFFIGAGVDGGLRALVRGSFSVEVRTRDGESLTFGGSSTRTWSELVIEDVESATVAFPGAEVTSAPRDLKPGPHSAASLGFTPVRAAAPAMARTPAEATLAAPVAEATLPPSVPFDLVPPTLPLAPSAPASAPAPAVGAAVRGTYDDLFGEVTMVGRIEDAAVREEAPETPFDPEFDTATIAVSAILCPHDHPNPPERSTCWKCSAALTAGTVLRMPRPALGDLAFDDGRTVTITGTILIGRSPRAERTDSAGIPELVVVESPNNDVSRTHARVFVEGWQVLLEDLGSTNGTLVTGPDGIDRRIRAGEPAILVDGARVDLGDGARFTVVGVP